MAAQIKLGILVPSSNTSLEPLTSAIISSLPNVSVHFSRFPVTKIALSQDALAQFDDAPILHAAQLLADAEVDIIGWSGTSAGWGAERKGVSRAQRRGGMGVIRGPIGDV